jgi:hypothetical protein
MHLEASDIAEEMEVITDLIYGDDPLHRWDLYKPAPESAREIEGLIVFVHGGAWRRLVALLIFTLIDRILTSVGPIAATNPNIQSWHKTW